MIVADSDVLIDFLRGNGEAKRVALELTTSNFATTTVTAFELLAGARTDKHMEAVETLLQAMKMLPFGLEEARLAATIHRDLEDSGQGIGMADCMIAAACIKNRGVLLTRNLKHFCRIPELHVSGVSTVPRGKA
jgi:tRNA(fMet)-specific endonuclease VapC